MFPADYAIRPDDLAREVEQRGFESLFLTEHTHIPATEPTRRFMEKEQGVPVPEYFYKAFDLFSAMAFAASATTTLRIASGVCLAAQHHPITLAKSLASLDVLSAGRILVGVGAGWLAEEAANHGVDPATRWRVMEEKLRAVREIWTRDIAEFHGRYVGFPPIYSWPKPHRGTVPVLVGGDGPPTLRRVVQIGDEWMPHAGMPIPALRTRIAELQALAEEAGRQPIPVTLFGAEPDPRLLDQLRSTGVTRAVVYVEPDRPDQVRRSLDGYVALQGA
jgi:probable F420-dependent oxidoreductase